MGLRDPKKMLQKIIQPITQTIYLAPFCPPSPSNMFIVRYP